MNLQDCSVEQLEAHLRLMKFPFYRKQLAKIDDCEDESIHEQYKISSQYKLISESDGQFTGGVYDETYRVEDEVHEFIFEKGKLIYMTRYNAELYD